MSLSSSAGRFIGRSVDYHPNIERNPKSQPSVPRSPECNPCTTSISSSVPKHIRPAALGNRILPSRCLDIPGPIRTSSCVCSIRIVPNRHRSSFSVFVIGVKWLWEVFRCRLDRYLLLRHGNGNGHGHGHEKCVCVSWDVLVHSASDEVRRSASWECLMEVLYGWCSLISLEYS